LQQAVLEFAKPIEPAVKSKARVEHARVTVTVGVGIDGITSVGTTTRPSSVKAVAAVAGTVLIVRFRLWILNS
jgi:hypothetical protein